MHACTQKDVLTHNYYTANNEDKIIANNEETEKTMWTHLAQYQVISATHHSSKFTKCNNCSTGWDVPM